MREIKRWIRDRAKLLWESRWAGIVLIFVWTIVAAALEYWTPAPGIAVAAMGVAASLMAARTYSGGLQKAGWMLVITAFLVVEAQAIKQDRHAHDVELSNLLAQTMGADSYPIFMAIFPGNGTNLFPVQVVYPPQPTADTWPLIDVNVNVSVRPSKGTGIDGITPEVRNSLFTPAHYNLGNLVRGIFPAPFKLEAGKRYQLSITTRRNSYYENINIDESKNSPGGYNISWCLYRYSDNKLLDGKCN
jgi:hypothetical protein